jgi:hypothetical protein
MYTCMLYDVLWYAVMCVYTRLTTWSINTRIHVHSYSHSLTPHSHSHHTPTHTHTLTLTQFTYTYIGAGALRQVFNTKEHNRRCVIMMWDMYNMRCEMWQCMMWDDMRWCEYDVRCDVRWCKMMWDVMWDVNTLQTQTHTHHTPTQTHTGACILYEFMTLCEANGRILKWMTTFLVMPVSVCVVCVSENKPSKMTYIMKLLFMV